MYLRLDLQTSVSFGDRLPAQSTRSRQCRTADTINSTQRRHYSSCRPPTQHRKCSAGFLADKPTALDPMHASRRVASQPGSSTKDAGAGFFCTYLYRTVNEEGLQGVQGYDPRRDGRSKALSQKGSQRDIFPRLNITRYTAPNSTRVLWQRPPLQCRLGVYRLPLQSFIKTRPKM